MRSVYKKHLGKLSIHSIFVCFSLFLGLLIPTQSGYSQQGAQWIWSSPKDKAKPNEVVYFRSSFQLEGKARKSQLYVTCDNKFELYLNGIKIASGNEWGSPTIMDVSKYITNPGDYQIAIKAGNDGGTVAGLLFDLKIRGVSGARSTVQSNSDWVWSHSSESNWNKITFDDSKWAKAVTSGKYGVAPWGAIGKGNRNSSPGQGIAPDNLKIVKGFKVEKIYDVPRDSQGSWVALSTLPNGDLVASDQGNKGLFRISLNSGTVSNVSRIPVNISGAQGLQYAFNRLYVHVNGKGLFMVSDSNKDGEFDKLDQLPGPNGGGEHGNHAVITSENQDGLYVVAGNHTNVPEFINRSRIDMDWREDLLLPRQWDARGHARGRLAPGGWIAKMTPDGVDWDIISIGYRNQYDVAINRHGDMFTYDADMEWDMGSKWYRPTRICHVTSGSEFGWRSGTGKWPEYFEDSLPATIDIGPGSPTGAVFGTGAKFPAKYQDALYALDWTFGTVYAVHLTPNGASYTATKEEFLTGSPFPVTDAIVGADGALYIAVGGRGTQSALYRVTYIGRESTAPATGGMTAQDRMQKNRRLRLEQWHRPDAPLGMDVIWPELGAEDRFIRYAARIALEHRPVDAWKEKAFSESDIQTRISAIIAWARQGDSSDLSQALSALLKTKVSECSKQQLLGLMRAYSLCFIRHGKPTEEVRQAIIAHLGSINLQNDLDLQSEWVRLNVYLDSSDVVQRGLAFINNNKPEKIPAWGQLIARNARYGGTIGNMLAKMPPASRTYLAMHLRNVKYGWTTEQRKQYFDYLNFAASHSGGASYKGFIENIRKEAFNLLSDSEKKTLEAYSAGQVAQIQAFQSTPPKGPGKAWTVDQAMAAIKNTGAKPDFASGRNLFHATACSACHLFAGEGGAIGPDLSSVRNKFSVSDLLESIIEPSKIISDQYGSSILTTRDGVTYQGRVVTQNTNRTKAFFYEVYSPDPKAKPNVIAGAKVKSIKESPVSQMPPGLINGLNAKELNDLVAYLLSRGNPEDPIYK